MSPADLGGAATGTLSSDPALGPAPYLLPCHPGGACICFLSPLTSQQLLEPGGRRCQRQSSACSNETISGNYTASYLVQTTRFTSLAPREPLFDFKRAKLNP